MAAIAKMTGKNGVHAAVETVSNVQSLIHEWSKLEPLSDAAVFVSTAWLMPWLEMAIKDFDVLLVKAEADGCVIGLGLLVRRKVSRRLFTVDTLFVNEAGPSGIDFCIEHNGFLLHRQYEREALMAMLRCLGRAFRWDELQLRRVGLESAIHRLSSKDLSELDLRLCRAEQTIAPYVDLREVRTQGGSFLDGLTTNRRGQIRRALRKLEQYGPLEVTVAKTYVEATQYLEALKHYHQHYWMSKGEPGVFSNSNWESFHKRLIAIQIHMGGVQLLRIRAGETLVGYIYSLVRKKRVYMIQSGFNYDLDPKAHPGECSHALAIEWNLTAGNEVYDFLAGDMRYKRSLSNRMVTMENVVLQRKRWRFFVEDWLRTVYRQLASQSA